MDAAASGCLSVPLALPSPATHLFLDRSFPVDRACSQSLGYQTSGFSDIRN